MKIREMREARINLLFQFELRLKQLICTNRLMQKMNSRISQ